MNICVIFPSHESFDVAMPNLSVYLIAAVIREQGHQVDVYDQGTYYHQLNIHIPKYDVICISCNSFNWCNAKKTIHEIKDKFPKMPIVLGGVHPSRFDTYIMNSTKVDYIIAGEGERAIVALLDAISDKKQLTQIPSLTYRDKKGEIIKNPKQAFLRTDELGALPMPAYDLITSNIFQTLTYEFSRGCINACVFCSSMYIKKWRPFPVERIIKGLNDNRAVIAKYDNKISATDDCFTTSPRRVSEICRAINQAELPFEFGIEAKVKDLTRENIYKYLWEISLFYLQIGVESGYDRGLSLVNKRITVQEILKCAQMLSSQGLIDYATFSFIIGFPWENKNDCITTIDFARKMVDTYGGFASISWWTPLPSHLYDIRNEYGCFLDEQIFDDKDWVFDLDIFRQFHPSLSVEDVHDILNYFNNKIKRFSNVNINTTYLGHKASEYDTLLAF